MAADDDTTLNVNNKKKTDTGRNPRPVRQPTETCCSALPQQTRPEKPNQAAQSETETPRLHRLFSPLDSHRKPSYHLPDVGEESVSEVLCGFDGELSGKVVDGAHEDPVSLHAAGTEATFCLLIRNPNCRKHLLTLTLHHGASYYTGFL